MLNVVVDGLNVSVEICIGLIIFDDGIVFFIIMGLNIVFVWMMVLVFGGWMDVMVVEINSYVLVMGVSVSLLLNGDWIVLIQDIGFDIVLGDYIYFVGGMMQVNYVDENGMVLGLFVLLGVGNIDVCFIGDLVFEVFDVFIVGYKGSFYMLDVDIVVGGLVECSFVLGGVVQFFDFVINFDFDVGVSSVDGLIVQVNVSWFDLIVCGINVSYFGVILVIGVVLVLC